MADLASLFSEMLATLRDARQAVASELEPLIGAAYLDRRALVVLDQSTRGFAEQANVLIVMMAETDAPDELVAAAEELVDFFQDARERIETILAVGRA